MKCPFCSNLENKVIDSRLSKDGNVIRRRRECLDCERRFTTYERIEDVLPSVVKKDERREPFDRIKILNGIKKACEKRPVSIDTIENAVEEIEREFQGFSEREVKSADIGERVMKALYKLDEVAYVRFASVYREFKDVSDFMVEVQEVLGEQKEDLKE